MGTRGKITGTMATIVALAALCGTLLAADAQAQGRTPIACKRAPAGSVCVPARCPAKAKGLPCKPKGKTCRHRKSKCRRYCAKHPRKCVTRKPGRPAGSESADPSAPDQSTCDKRCRSIADYLHNCEQHIQSQRDFYPDLTPMMCEWPSYIDAFPQDLYDAAIAAWITCTATQAQLDAIEAASPDEWY